MQHGLAWAGLHSFAKCLDSLVEAVEPLEAPADSQPRLDPFRNGRRNTAKEWQGISKQPQRSQSLRFDQDRFRLIPQGGLNRLKRAQCAAKHRYGGGGNGLVWLHEKLAEFQKPGCLSKQMLLAYAIHRDAE